MAVCKTFAFDNYKYSYDLKIHKILYSFLFNVM